jgi:glycosyltransferase involved in cell wall biosynthesis
LIIRAAEANPDAIFVVVASGVGVQALEATILRNLIVLPLQSIETLPGVLASADILIAMIEPDAGRFSVPSKVLSYLCAGKPIVMSAPRENLAAQIINDASAGAIVAPEDAEAFQSEVKRLLRDQETRNLMGRSGRRYAEEHFDISEIADRFEGIFDSLRSG